MENRTIKQTYDYKDELGELLYQVVRYEPKDFRQRRPDGNGDWLWNLDGVRRVLYRLQELLQANPEKWVCLTEGEKDTDRLIDLGLVATTCPMGAGKWQDDYGKFLNDRKVAIVPDNDETGKKHAKKVAHSLTEKGIETRVVELPGMSKGSDVSDWLNNGGTSGDLLELIESTEPFIRPIEQLCLAFNLTDAGNGERFAAQHGDKMRYCWKWDKWLFYDGRRWNVETGAEAAERLAVETARSIIQEADGKNYEQRGPILKWSYQSESGGRLVAMQTRARSVPPVGAYPDDFNTNPWTFNCNNGTIELQTGKLRKRRPADMITKLCPVDYDPNAKFQMWDDFLEDATGGDESVRHFLQTAVGYSLTSFISEEKLFFIHGDAATGKSTFLEAIKAVLGDYAITADFETFLHRKQVGVPRNDIARLYGARFVTSIEVDEGKKLAEGLVKMLTGGDTVSTRFLYKESFEFVPEFKLWLAANHAPRIRDDDAAIWRRIIRVPFEHIIPDEKQDPKIKTTLRNPKIAGPAILAWAVQGCLRWQREGLPIPDTIRQSTKEYRESQDPLREFVEDNCVFNENAFVPVAELRAAYDQHCKDNGTRYPLGPRQFNDRLRARGCESKPKRYKNEIGTEAVAKCWDGVTLKTNGRYDKSVNQAEIQEEIPF